MNTLPQVIENLRANRSEDDTERQLVLRSAMLMAIRQLELEGQLPCSTREMINETELILAQYPDLWPVLED